MTKFQKWTLIISVVGIGLTVFGVMRKGQSTKTQGDKSPIMEDVRTKESSVVAQIGDNFSGTINIYGSEESNKEIGKLKRAIEQLKEKNKGPFPDRPKVEIVDATVTFVDHTHERGPMKASFVIKFLNIGGVNAKNIATTWTIDDNDEHITDPNVWRESQGGKPLVIEDLQPGIIVTFSYAPDIGETGAGTLKLSIEYKYTDSKTGETYSGEFKGFVDYKIDKKGVPKPYKFSPL